MVSANHYLRVVSPPQHAPTVFWGFSALYYLLRPDGATPSRERVNALRGVVRQVSGAGAGACWG